MDKQMIEEMAKLVQGDMCGDVPCEECNYHGKMKILPRYCGVYLIAEKLYNAGYCKIPEGAVVLTETEYNDLLSDEVKTIERDIAEYWATEEVATVAKELHKEGYRKIDDHAILVLRKAKCLEQKIRKETAEKFAERLKTECFDGGIDDKRVSVSFSPISQLFTDIATIGLLSGVGLISF